MTDSVWEMGPGAFMTFTEDPGPQRTRIEIVADDLGCDVKIDYEADMAYIEVRKGKWAWNDVKQEDNSLILDYDEDDNLLGVEIFLVKAAVLPTTVAALEQLLPKSEED